MGIRATFFVAAAAVFLADAEPIQPLVVIVYNYAKVPTQKLSGAEAIAGKVYASAGVTVNWIDCPLVEEDTERFRTCDRAVDAGDPYLRILPEGMARGNNMLKRMADALGVAFGDGAIIAYSRVREMAEEWNCSEEVILARSLAHELGHILLGEESHSTRGIMKPRFGRRDLLGESAQQFFEPKQAARLREFLSQSRK